MRTRLTGWTLGAVLLLVVGVQAQVQENTAIMLRGTNLLPSNAAGVISNALSLGPFSTNTNLVITNIDGLQTALDGKLATNGILPAYTNVAGLQSWVTNINAPLFLPVGTTAGTVAAGDDARITNAVQQGGVGNFSQLRTSEGSVMLGNGASADSGGGAVGNSANAIYGGGAVGNSTKAFYGGGAVGSDAHADYGGAVGYGADSSDNLISGTGFAGGYNAKAKGPNRVQLGTGINATDGTMQFLSFPLVAADGKIPVERLPVWVNTNPAVVRTNLGLGATNSVTFAGLTNTGDTVLGSAVANSLATPVGTFEAPNATNTSSNRVANVGALRTVFTTPQSLTPDMNSRVQLGTAGYNTGVAIVRGHASGLTNGGKIALVGEGWMNQRVITMRLSFIAGSYGYLDGYATGNGSFGVVAKSGDIYSGGAQYSVVLNGDVTVSVNDIITGAASGAEASVWFANGGAGPNTLNSLMCTPSNGKLFTSADTNILVNGVPTGVGVTNTTFGASPAPGLYIFTEPTVATNVENFNLMLLNTSGATRNNIIWEIMLKK